MFTLKKSAHKEERLIPNLSWEADIVLNERTSRRLAWRVASGAIAMAFTMALAVVLLLPLKQVVPYVVEVDKLTGETNVVSSAKEFVTTTALSDKHWLKSFVIARERYKYVLLQHDYDTVKSLAGDKVWQTYFKQYDGADSQEKKLADRVEKIPTILSIVLHGDGVATVRYEVRTLDSDKPQATVSRNVATVRYSYRQQIGKKEADMVDNPLGFTAEAYQTDPEFVTAAPDQKVAK